MKDDDNNNDEDDDDEYFLRKGSGIFLFAGIVRVQRVGGGGRGAFDGHPFRMEKGIPFTRRVTFLELDVPKCHTCQAKCTLMSPSAKSQACQ